MPNIATILKQEISRLARKEVKTLTESTRKASARHRREIADLKRQIQDLSRKLSDLESRERRRAPDAQSESAASGRRFSAKGVKAHRDRLDLSAAEMASLLGVSAQTIYNWEQGRTRPRGEQLTALIELRSMGKREVVRRLDAMAS